MRRKKRHEDEHVDESWLLPYSDLITLLLALFIVMFASSSVDVKKLESLSAQFQVIFSGGSGVMEQGSDSNIPAEVESPSNSMVEEYKMKEISEALNDEIKKSGYADKINVSLTDEGLEISMQDVILFNSGEAEVLSDAYPLLKQIAAILRNMDNNIKFVGHTDNMPIQNSKFRSNWDLSAMRAINVMNFMVNEGGINPKLVSIQAYGEEMPKYDNSTEEGRAKNRRVEIDIVRKYSKE